MSDEQWQRVYRAKENYAEAIATALELCLKQQCGLFLDDARREKLHLFVEREILS